MIHPPYLQVISDNIKEHAEASKTFGLMLEHGERGDENAKNILAWLRVAFEAGRQFQEDHPGVPLGDEGLRHWAEQRGD